MFENVQVVAFIIAGIVAYRSVFFGIIVLLISLCTFRFVSNYTSIDLPVGSLAMADFVIVAIFVKTLRAKKIIKGDTAYVLCLGMICWLTLSVFLALIEGQAGLRETYRQIFRIALFWILPITVREMDALQRRRLVTACLIIAGIVSCIQLYVVLFEKTTLMDMIYSSGSYEVYGYQSPEEQYRHLITQDISIRLYPSASLLVQMVFVFTLGLVFFRNSEHGKLFPLAILVLSFLFVASLGGRSNSLLILFSVLCVFYILFRGFWGNRRLVHKKGLNLVFRGIFILFLCIGILMNFGGAKIFGSFVDRWTMTLGKGYIDTTVRVSDTLEAWDVLLGSPLWGIGQSKVSWQIKFMTYGGEDIHPFLSQGLIGGFPGIFLLFCWIFLLFGRFKEALAVSFRGETHKYYILSAAVALFSALFLSLIGTTPAFLYGAKQVPFGIFSGLLLLPLKVPYRVMRTRIDKT